jgi:hypothetical protein
MMNLINRNAAFFAVGGFIAALFLAGLAHAITDTAFKYSSPKTGYLSIPAGAFANRFDFDTYVNGGNLLHSNSVDPAGFVAPVNLPNGATMTQLSVWYTPTSGNPINIELYRTTLSDGSVNQIVFQSPSGMSGVRKQSNYPINNPSLQTVDNAHYAYYLVLGISTVNDLFYAGRITYSYTNAGD